MSLDRHTSETLIQVVAILGYILSAILVFFGLAAFFGNRFILSFVPELGLTIISRLFYVSVTLIFGLAVFQFIVAKGLWHHKNWARTAQLVLVVFMLFRFPAGTIVGAAVIYLLAFDKTTTALFR